MKNETETELVEVLQRIAVSLNEQNVLLKKQSELFAKSTETSQRVLAVQILNSKLSAKAGVVINSLSVVEYKEFLELINQI